MVIEINKDIDRYQESVAMGLTAKQLVFSIASVIVGGGIVLLLYRYIGLTGSAYVAIPCVAPIALGGFYSFNGMNFYEYMGKKLHFMFGNKALTYVSTEGEPIIKAFEMEQNGQVKKKGKNQRSDQGQRNLKKLRHSSCTIHLCRLIQIRGYRGESCKPENHCVTQIFPDIAEHQHKKRCTGVHPVNRMDSAQMQDTVDKTMFVKHQFPEQHKRCRWNCHRHQICSFEQTQLLMKCHLPCIQQKGKH